MGLPRRGRPRHDSCVAADGWAKYDDLVQRDRDRLDSVQRLLVAFGELRTELNNGGFAQYFVNSAGDHVMEVIIAARSVGVEELATLVEQAMALLVGG